MTAWHYTDCKHDEPLHVTCRKHNMQHTSMARQQLSTAHQKLHTGRCGRVADWTCHGMHRLLLHTVGDQGKKVIEGLTADLRGARVITTVFVNGEPQTAIELIEGIRKHR